MLAGGRLSQFKETRACVTSIPSSSRGCPRRAACHHGGDGWYGRHLIAVAEDRGVAERVRFLAGCLEKTFRAYFIDLRRCSI